MDDPLIELAREAAALDAVLDTALNMPSAGALLPAVPARPRAAVEPRNGRPGRPAVALNLAVVEGMASVGATNYEIADFLGCDEGTIRRRCGDVLLRARARLRTRLRRAQLRAALDDHNPAMLIWLGKQMLQQQDKHEQVVSAPDGGPVKVIVTHTVVDPRRQNDDG